MPQKSLMFVLKSCNVAPMVHIPLFDTKSFKDSKWMCTACYIMCLTILSNVSLVLNTSCNYHHFLLSHYYTMSTNRCWKCICSAIYDCLLLFYQEKPKSKRQIKSYFLNTTIKLHASTSPWSNPHACVASSALSAIVATSWIIVLEKDSPQISK